MSKEKKIMIRIAYEDETGKKDMRDILAKDYQDALSQLRGEICSGSKIYGMDEPVEVEVEEAVYNLPDSIEEITNWGRK